MNELASKLTVTFVTSNMHKFNEIKQLFEELIDKNFQLKHLKSTLIEIQSFHLDEIVTYSVKTFSSIARIEPFFAEDSGIFIEELKGFPGPYSAYVYETLGLEGILALMQGIKNRKAYFQSTIALKTVESVEIFRGRVDGKISTKISKSGWGYDPIFLPNNYDGLTYGELGERKLFISHRYKATVKLIEFLKKKYINFNR